MFKSLTKMAKEFSGKKDQPQQGGEQGGEAPKKKSDPLAKGVGFFTKQMGIKTDDETNAKLAAGARGQYDKHGSKLK
ncbi:MAG: hypothetical protein M1840_004678 [Geoglossum simile]|nr:MAG: hypothetical protein M1840_004678 [Geoglossum simile]